MRICPFCGDNVVGNHTDCRMNQPTEEQHATEADIDAARDIIAEGRASHAGWAEHLKRCPGCEQCKTLGIDWGWEREQSWVERYDFLLGVIDSFAAERIENTHLREAFVTMEKAYNEAEAAIAALKDYVCRELTVIEFRCDHERREHKTASELTSLYLDVKAWARREP